MVKTQKRKLRLGWFSFTCCEDSAIIFSELLNEHYQKWSGQIEFRYFQLLKKNNRLQDLDVAFIEGAIASSKQAKKLKTIRANAKKLVAVGACAVTGLPAGQRNTFDAKTKREIDPLLKRFNQLERVQIPGEIVKIDAEIPGCPMDEKIFLKVLNNYLKEFGIGHA